MNILSWTERILTQSFTGIITIIIIIRKSAQILILSSRMLNYLTAVSYLSE